MQLSFLIQLILLLLLVISVYMVFTNTVVGRTKLILIVICVVLGLYLFSKLNIFNDYNEYLDSPTSAKENVLISEDLLKKSDGHFAISSWIFIDDWNYKYGEEKIILKKEMPDTRGDMNLPYIGLDPYKNDLIIKMNVFDDTKDTFSDLLKKELQASTSFTNIYTIDDYDTFGCSGENTINSQIIYVQDSAGGGSTIDTDVSCISASLEDIVVENINMQKWVNIITTVNNRSIDVYINGKLVKTKTFNNVIDTAAFNHGGISITPNGGFGGFVSKIQYYPYYITPEKAWSIYKGGFGDAFESTLNKYNMSMSFYRDSVEQNKFYLF